MSKLVRKIGLVAHDAMKKDLIEWVLWNSERLIGHKFYCTGTTGTLIREALKEKHPDVEWDITILKSGPLGGDQQIGSRIVEGEIDYLFFFTDPMTLQPHDTDVKALTRLAGVENIVFCCNRSTADHIITSPLFLDREYERTHPDYTGYTQRFANKPVVMRTLDIGADKDLPYFSIEEENSALGWRGIRFTLDHPEIFSSQIRAMLKASIGLNNLHILLPMVTSVSEVEEALYLLCSRSNALGKCEI